MYITWVSLKKNMFWLFGITESLFLQFGYTTSKESAEDFCWLRNRHGKYQNQTQSYSELHFFIWFVTKRNCFWFWIFRKSVITILIWFNLTRFKINLSEFYASKSWWYSLNSFFEPMMFLESIINTYVERHFLIICYACRRF